MLLTITTTCTPATDLDFLLHKHPDRAQTFRLNYGLAHVFYPEASYEPLRRVHECVFAIMALESEPIDPRL